MKLRGNYRSKLHRPANGGLVLFAFLGINFTTIALTYSIFMDAGTSPPKVATVKKSPPLKVLSAATPQPVASPTVDLPKPTTPQTEADIGLVLTTVFWVGESATADNDNIQNNASAWVADWVGTYGGVDNPAKRSGYLPAGFTPKENPFYVALPYNDLDINGARKPTASSCPNASAAGTFSWCKNAWVSVSCNGKTAYGQWEDAGPNGEDDFAYVFGSAQPANQFGVKAGLDVSPAIRDYVGLGDVGRCTWKFIASDSVPEGPWKQIVTTTPSYQVSQ